MTTSRPHGSLTTSSGFTLGDRSVRAFFYIGMQLYKFEVFSIMT